MKQLGAQLPFDQFKADFSGITSEKSGLYVSNVIHQAVVEVNEEGTEAAAATAVVMMTRMAVIHQDPFDFICNRPFIFIIHDTNQNNILFYGKYALPV
jgi:serpin B